MFLNFHSKVVESNSLDANYSVIWEVREENEVPNNKNYENIHFNHILFKLNAVDVQVTECRLFTQKKKKKLHTNHSKISYNKYI